MAFLLVIPILLALAEIGREADAVLRWLNQARQGGVEVPAWLERLPLLGSSIDQWWRTHLTDPQGLVDLFGGVNADTFTAWTRSIGGELAYRLLLAVLTFMTLFMLLRDGRTLSARVGRVEIGGVPYLIRYAAKGR